jgi:hypothetical protein
MRIGGAEIYFHAFLTSALDESEWSASRPGCFNPREKKYLQYPLDTSLSGPQSRSGRGGEENHHYRTRKSNPDRPARRLVSMLTELPRFL